MEIPENYKKNIYRVILGFIIVLSLYYVARFLYEFKSYRMLGDNNNKTITLSGHGEISAVPDIANIYFTIEKEKKTVKEAQNEVSLTEKKALDFLREIKVDSKDIKTSNASFAPKYEYVYEKITCTQYYCPPNPGKNVIVGYTVSESITVKVRNTDDVGKIMQELGKFEVSELNGPNFTVDKEDELKAEARKKAIDDAKTKAKILAKDLGVKLGKITVFYESPGYSEMMYSAKASTADYSVSAEPAPEIPKGENTISADVTITYEIK